MKRILAIAAVATMTGLVGVAAPASAANGTSEENCNNTVHGQVDRGVQAGGGPKAGEPGPTNCDHYWQRFGFIGK
jgi:hypothetical protein